MMSDRLGIANELYKLGLPVLPCEGKVQIHPREDDEDGTKKPLKWEIIKTDFEKGCNIALDLGWFFCFDFDRETKENYPLFWDKLPKNIKAKLVVEQTGREPYGIHIIGRSRKIVKSKKLAKDKFGNDVIDFIGAGKYIVIQGSIHPDTHKLYTPVHGNIFEIQYFTDEEIELMVEIAKGFNRYHPPVKDKKGGEDIVDLSNPNLPSNIFAKNNTWEKLLEDAGWKFYKNIGEIVHWTRPGKSSGTSATTGYCGESIHIFSGNCEPLQEGHSYTKAQFLCETKFKGNWDDTITFIKNVYCENSDGLSDGFDKKFEKLRKDKKVEEVKKIINVEKLEVIDYNAYLYKGNHLIYCKDKEGLKLREKENILIYNLIPNGYIKHWIDWKKTSTDAPLIFHLGMALINLGMDLGRNVWIVNSEIFYPNLYILLLAESTALRKSTAIGLRDSFINDDEVIKNFTYAFLFEKFGHTIKKQDGRTIQDLRKEKEFALKREGITQTKILIHQDEFEVLMDKIENGKESLRGELTTLYGNPSNHTKGTKGEGEQFIYNPFTSIIGASTKEGLKGKLTKETWKAGFISRFIVLPGKKTYSLGITDEKDGEAYNKLIACRERIINNIKGEMIWEHDVKTIWNDFAVKERNHDCKSMFGRLTDSVLKIATLYACSEETKIISKNHMEKAILLANLIMKNMIDYYDNEIAFSDEELGVKLIKGILKDFKDKGLTEITDAQIKSILPAKGKYYIKNDDRENAIRQLCGTHLIRKDGFYEIK